MGHSHFIYIIAAIILANGLYMMISSDHYVKKIIGLTIFQNAILIFYISIGKVSDGVIPIDQKLDYINYSNPIPHVLMLTAIVVGFATLAVSLGLASMIKREFGSLSISAIKSSEKFRK